MAEDTNPLQESMERSAKLGEVFFPAPPRSLSYVLIGLLTVATAALLGATLSAAVSALLLVFLPAVAASLATPGLARLVGRRFYHRRSVFLALIGAVLVAGGIATGVLGQPLGVDTGKVLYLAVGFLWVLRLAAITIVADNRFGPAFALATVQPLFTLPGLLYLEDGTALAIGALFWAALLLPFVLMQRVFDAPLQRNFGISGAELFRSYLDHLTTRSLDTEDLLARLGEPIEAQVSAVVFKRPDGSRKACIVVPVVHPGPFGALGGGDLPAKMREALRDWEYVLVPHAAANHDLNPVTSAEVERLGHYAAELADRTEVRPGGSKFIQSGDVVRVGAQYFGPDVLLTYTSWPEAIDDVDWGVGRAAELTAQVHGARYGVFTDCHNSLRASAGAVFALTPRAIQIEKETAKAVAACGAAKVDELRVGCAQDRSLGMTHLIGRAGCQAVVVEAGDQRTAYVLWDGNNMVPEATKAIQDAVGQFVDEVRVMTTDNHAVNLEGGVYSPVGLRTPHETLAKVASKAVQEAIDDLEPVHAGAAMDYAPGIRVVGHQKTAQLSASVNTMVAIAPEVAVATVGLWVLGVLAIFLAF